LPNIFNDDNNVDAPETYKLVKLVLLNIVVDVACKFDIFNDEYVDKLFKFVIVELPVKAFIIFNNVVDVEFKLFIDNIVDVDKVFKLLNIVVLVAFKLFIDNIEDVDKLYKFTLVPYIDKSGLFIIVEFQSD
jgi:hypothetical protein